AMNIWQLRDYARKLGHDSPTSQRKQQLIDFVLQKHKEGTTETVEVQIDEQPKKRGRGRPPKKVVTNYEDILPKTENIVAADSGVQVAPIPIEIPPAPPQPVLPYDYHPERKPERKEYGTEKK